MSKPVKPTWAFGDPSYAIPPSAGKQNVGWLPGEKPPYQYMNWIHLRSGEWFTYLENKTETTSPTMLRSASTVAWSGSALTFTQPIEISFRVTTGEQVNRIGVSASPITLLDGQVLVFIKDKINASPVTLAAGSYSTLIAGQYVVLNENTLTAANQENEVVLFRRRGTDLEIPISGAIYPSGSTITLGSYSVSSGSITIDASQVVSGTFANARIAASNVTQHQGSLSLAASQITSGTFADARITASNVTQHQAALSIAASQITSGTLSVGRGGTGVTTPTGSGSVVLTNSPQIANPLIDEIRLNGSNSSPAATGRVSQANTIVSMCFGAAAGGFQSPTTPYNATSYTRNSQGNYTLDFAQNTTDYQKLIAHASPSAASVGPIVSGFVTGFGTLGAAATSVSVTVIDDVGVEVDCPCYVTAIGG
jgi:hypothetical protein